MAERKVFRLWKPVEFSDSWNLVDTSVIDDISASWFERRKVLEEQSKEYEQFITELKRAHAGKDLKERVDTTIPLDIEPHVVSIKDGLEAKEKNICAFLERALTVSLAQIASEI